jgi:serine/threonine-protein kinase
MDDRKTPLFAHLERALRKAYDRPLEDQGAGTPSVGTSEPEAAIPEQLGRYRIRGVIARGGMGSVLRAEDPELGRDVAIKVSRSGDPALLELFANEARICSQLQHPGIVPVYERGRTGDSRPWYVMKLIEGETLATLLGARASPAADLDRMIEVFTAVCRTMAYVHSRGFFHGDLKPGNVMVGAFGEVQVMDWGIAGEVSESAGDTKAPLAAGTPAYMPPERARGDRGHAGIRSDVFSLGAILCEILAGDPPYRGSHRSEIYRRAVNADLGEARDRLAASGADGALVALAVDCLAVDPAARPADAEAIAHRIDDHVKAVGRRARDAEIDLARAHARHASERRARRLTLALAAAVILGLVAGGVGFLMLREEKLTRQADAARLVDEAIGVAHEALAEARVTQPPDPERWANAEAAAVRAVALAERSTPAEGTAARARALLAETHALRENRLRYLAFQERIEDLEHHGLEEDRKSAWLDAAYRAAFRDAGIDVARVDADPPTDVGARAALSLALANWALARGRAQDPPTRRDLLQAATIVDPDPDRKDLCSAFLAADHDRLLAAARAAESSDASPESMLLLSKFLGGLNHPDEAIGVLRAACSKHPGDFNLHHDLAARLGSMTPPPHDEIIRLMSMCVAIRPASAHALTDLGSAHYSNEQSELAVVALEKATALQPDHARGWLTLAVVRRDLGELDRAREAAERAVQCESDADALVRTAADCWRRGLVEPAKSALRKAVRAAPRHAVARAELGRIALIEGSPEQAVAPLREAVEISPTMGAAWASLGAALSATQNVDDARDALEKALELGESSPDVALSLAEALLREGAVERALDVLGRAANAPLERTALMRLAAELATPEDAVRLGTDSRSGRTADVAAAASVRGWFRASAKLWEAARAGEPVRGSAIEAARAAALAGRGFGADAAGIGAADLAALRERALALLEGEIGVARREWEADHLRAPAWRRRLRGWVADAAFPSEGRSDFAALPAVERRRWEELWKGAGALLADFDRLVLPDGVVVQAKLSAAEISVSGPLAGTQFAPDGETLFLVGGAGSKSCVIHALPVVRDPATRAITGFGKPRVHAKAEHADGGLARDQEGAIYWSTWREHELGQLPSKGRAKRFPLTGSGMPAGGGGLAFVPAGARAGELLMSSYADGGIYSLDLGELVEGVRAPVPGSAVLVARVPRGIEGIRFLHSGRFAPSLLVANWDAGVVSIVPVDPATWLPAAGEGMAATPRNFISGLAAASGLDVDPVSGALVVTTWGSGNRLFVLGGVGAPAK